MKTQYIILIVLVMILLSGKKLKVLSSQILRSDSSGSGKFGASRGGRTHKGVDLLVTEGEPVYSPFNGKVIRTTRPYADDAKYKGAVIASGDTEVKIFYFVPTVKGGETISKGQIIGYAQAISDKYGGSMQDHIHVEVRKSGQLVNPENLLL